MYCVGCTDPDGITDSPRYQKFHGKDEKKVNKKEIIESVGNAVYLTASQTLYKRFRDAGYGVRETARACNVSAATVSKTLKIVDRKLKGAESND